jgi:hypothetical protein
VSTRGVVVRIPVWQTIHSGYEYGDTIGVSVDDGIRSGSAPSLDIEICVAGIAGGSTIALTSDDAKALVDMLQRLIPEVKRWEEKHERDRQAVKS